MNNTPIDFLKFDTLHFRIDEICYFKSYDLSNKKILSLFTRSDSTCEFYGINFNAFVKQNLHAIKNRFIILSKDVYIKPDKILAIKETSPFGLELNFKSIEEWGTPYSLYTNLSKKALLNKIQKCYSANIQ